MTTLHEAAQQALEALERIDTLRHVDIVEVHLALRAALAQPAAPTSDNLACKSVQKRLTIQRGEVSPAPERLVNDEHPYTYASTQATKCAGCGEHKHTPLRIDAMGGYVCLTCIDQKLGSLLGEFGYPEPEVGPAGEAVASIYITADGAREMDDWKHDLPVGRNILYAAPQPAAPDNLACKSVRKRLAIQRGEVSPAPERVPLTNARIEELGVEEELLLLCDSVDALIEITRVVERAHGITPKEPT